MYQKVLFPTDFSPYSQRITGHIREIPGISEVVLLHIMETEGSGKKGLFSDAEVDRVKGLLAEDKKILEDQGLTVRVELDLVAHAIPGGTIGSQIQKTAEREKVSMIVMGARGKSPHDLMLGSVSTYVLHHTIIPLLLMKSPPDSTSRVTPMSSTPPVFSKVLLPTDFSAPAEEVIRFVKDVSGIDEIVLLHVINDKKSDPRLPGYMDLASKKMGAIRDELARSGFSVKDDIRVGYPPDEINIVAGQENVTLIALSPLGEGWVRGLKEFFVGSTTYAVVRRATCPVLVVRPGQSR